MLNLRQQLKNFTLFFEFNFLEIRKVKLETRISHVKIYMHITIYSTLTAETLGFSKRHALIKV